MTGMYTCHCQHCYQTRQPAVLMKKLQETHGALPAQYQMLTGERKGKRVNERTPYSFPQE